MTSLADLPIAVTGANGLVGARVCARLLEQGVPVRAVVRRPGTAPQGAHELVGDVADPELASRAVDGAAAVVSTVHPMGSDLQVQRAVGVDATAALARAARDAGVSRFVHVSTAAVYDRSPATGDVDETSLLVGEDAGDYPVTKRDADAEITQVRGLTRVLVRPPAVLGSAPSSVWNSRRPEAVRDGAPATAVAEATFAWVHVQDLVRMLTDLATGAVVDSEDPERGPVPGGCTAVDVAGEPAHQRDYWEAVTRALGVTPTWLEEPAWTGQYRTDRARRWGWTPRVGLAEALAEVQRDVGRLG